MAGGRFELSSALAKPGRRVVLVGNPNVGKSVIFRLLTGSYVLVSNFPGTTVEVSRGRLDTGGISFEVIDTPGINSLVPMSEDEQVTCEILIRERPDVVVQVADAKNLRRTLLITSQLAEFRLPLVLVLNMMDEAQERGIEVDTGGLAREFGIPVVETVAIYSRGRRQLLQAIENPAIPDNPMARLLPVAAHQGEPPPLGGLAVEWMGTGNDRLTKALEDTLTDRNVSAPTLVRDGPALIRGVARGVSENRLQLVESLTERFRKKREVRFVEPAGKGPLKGWLALLAAGIALLFWNEFGGLFGLPTPFGLTVEALARLASSLSGSPTGTALSYLMSRGASGSFEYGVLPELAHLLWFIAPVVVPLVVLLKRSRAFTAELGILTRRASTGIPALLVILLLVYEFVGYTGAQTLVGFLEEVVFGNHIVPAIAGLIPDGLAAEFLVGKYGLISMGLTYALAIVLPVVATFFIAFGILEDSGYLPRLSILTDRLMRSMGLNGKATLPMVLGLGCCTMATITTRILNSRKERIIATLLLALGIPCSAQLGVILGISAGYSAAATVTVMGVVVSQLFLVGYLASRLVRGERSPFLFEIPPIRVPQMRNVLLKTRMRIRWYLLEAVPLFLYGTLALFAADKFRIEGRSLLAWVQAGLQPVISGVLKLPADAATVFVLGFLRRDYGAAGLFDMARSGLLTSQQVVVSLVVITLFVPCLASFLVIAKEQGMRRAVMITGFIVPFAISVGAVVSWVLRTFNVTFQ